MTDLEHIAGNKPFSAFRATWEAARHGQAMPRRRDISLRNFSKFINEMFILEHVGPREYLYRQAGEAVKDRLAMTGPGVNLFDLMCPEVQDLSEEWWLALFGQQCAGMISYSIEYPAGVLRHARTMLLPVAHDDGRAGLLLGITHMDGERYLPEARGTTVIGEYLAHGRHLDVGTGVPPHGPHSYLYSPNPDFIDASL